MAKGQMRSTREKKKPKADRNKSKSAPPTSPFGLAADRGKLPRGPAGKKGF